MVSGWTILFKINGEKKSTSNAVFKNLIFKFFPSYLFFCQVSISYIEFEFDTWQILVKLWPLGHLAYYYGIASLDYEYSEQMKYLGLRYFNSSLFDLKYDKWTKNSIWIKISYKIFNSQCDLFCYLLKKQIML